METIVNARDVILQSASPRIDPIALASNITVSGTNLANGSVTPAKTALAAIDSTTGNLTANSVTATNINVSNLAAINANLGTVTAGNITGSANMSVSGYVKASGVSLSSVTYSGNYGATAGEFVTTGGAASASEWDIGLWGQVNGTATAAGKIGVIGIADQSNGYGVIGASSAGTGLLGNSSTGIALRVEGKMQITDSTLVSNLNAEFLGGVALAGIARRNQVDIEYSTDGGSTWNNIRFR